MLNFDPNIYIGDEHREFPTTPLYHYTSMESFKNIVETKRVFATNIYYMDDDAELSYGIDILKKKCEEIKRESSGKDTEIVEQYIAWLEIMSQPARPFYVCCFTEEDDDLNQWRSYTPPRLGINIGFDAPPIVERMTAQMWKFESCIYGKKHQSNLIDAFLEQFVNANRKWGTDQPGNEGYTTNFERTGNFVFNFLARLKHPAYSEEKEWRLISPMMQSMRNVKFRVGRSMLVPYVDVEIYGSQDNKLDIQRIVIGPTPHNELALKSIRSLMHDQIRGSKNDVVSSQIPFRNW